MVVATTIVGTPEEKYIKYSRLLLISLYREISDENKCTRVSRLMFEFRKENISISFTVSFID